MNTHKKRPTYIPQLRNLFKKLVKQNSHKKPIFSKENLPQWAVAFGTLTLAVITVFVLWENKQLTDIIETDQMLKLRPELQFGLSDVIDRYPKITNIGPVAAFDVRVHEKIYLATKNNIFILNETLIRDDMLIRWVWSSRASSKDTIWVRPRIPREPIGAPGDTVKSREEKVIAWKNHRERFKEIRKLFDHEDILKIINDRKLRCIIKYELTYDRELDKKSYSQCEFFEYSVSPSRWLGMHLLKNQIGGPALIERIQSYESEGEEKRIGINSMTKEIEINPSGVFREWRDKHGNEFMEDEKGRVFKKDTTEKWILLKEKEN